MKLYKIKYIILVEILSILLLTSCYGVLEDPVTVITNLAVLGEMFNMQIQPVDYRVEESHEE